MRFPTLEEAIACNEAVREPNETSPSADEDDLERVERALIRAGEHSDPIEAAASLAYEVTFAQGFYEGNKRTAVLLARWFITQNTELNPDLVIPPDDHKLADLLVAAARGEQVADDIEALLNKRARSPG